jgi:hypothetical protein
MKDAKGHGSDARGGGSKPGPQTAAHPNIGNRIAFALRNKLQHDAGQDDRLAAYAAAHGGQQAASANGARSPVMAHAGIKSVGTHPASGGGGGGGSSGGSSGGNGGSPRSGGIGRGGKSPTLRQNAQERVQIGQAVDERQFPNRQRLGDARNIARGRVTNVPTSPRRSAPYRR